MDMIDDEELCEELPELLRAEGPRDGHFRRFRAAATQEGGPDA